MVNAGLLLVGLQGYWVNIFLGVVVLVAVLINRIVIDRFVMSPDRAELEQPIVVADEDRPPQKLARPRRGRRRRSAPGVGVRPSLSSRCATSR